MHFTKSYTCIGQCLCFERNVQILQSRHKMKFAICVRIAWFFIVILLPNVNFLFLLILQIPIHNEIDDKNSSYSRAVIDFFFISVLSNFLWFSVHCTVVFDYVYHV